MIKFVNHISITVRDLKGMLTFFENVLEQKKIWPVYEYKGELADNITGLNNVHMRIGKVEINHMILEFIQYISPPGRELNGNTNDVGYPHIGFVVDDIIETYNKLLSRGVEFKSPPQLINDPANPMVGCGAVYFWGPERITLELVQVPQSSKGAQNA